MKPVQFVEYSDETGEEVTHVLPSKKEICSRCDGEGKHDHPAFSNGITASEMNEEWDEYDRELYFGGAYDVICSECKGAKIVLVLDEERAKEECPEVLKKYLDYKREHAQFLAEQESERRMGA